MTELTMNPTAAAVASAVAPQATGTAPEAAPAYTDRAAARAALFTALAPAQAEFEAVLKNKDNSAFRSKYADLEAILQAVRPALNRHGIFLYQTVTSDAAGVTVETVLVHKDGAELRSGPLTMPVAMGRGMTAHAIGSAITYGKRYSLAAFLGVAADEDDDGNAASDSTRANAPQKQAPQKPRTNPSAVRQPAPQPAPVPAPAALDPEEEAKRLQEFGWRIEEAETIDELKKIGLEISAIGFGPASKEALTRTWKERREALKAAAPADDFEATYGA